ncbi:MAG: HAD family hydrolase [candidate division Zixibacteria bacterium]|nr:HAD family hydrolase [candidate division Zixibacteria bacterium]
MKIKNLIFDLDGTLIDSSEGVVEAVNYSLRQMGQQEQKPETIKPFIGYALEVMYPEFTDAPLDELYRHFQVKAAESIVSSTVILDGVGETLAKLSENNYTMAIATTKIKKHVDKIINKFEWGPFFKAWVGGDEVAKVKPDPEIFFKVLKKMGAEPSETLVIGDTVNDILAARAVPMCSVAVLSPYGGRDKLLASKPDFVLDSMANLPELLEKIVTGEK